MNLFDIGITSEGKKMRIYNSIKRNRGFGFTHSNLRPINRLASKTVFRGFMAAWFLAASPIRRSSVEKATYDGVVRFPSAESVSCVPVARREVRN